MAGKNLKLNFTEPSLTFDAHAFRVLGSDAVEVVFFQVREETETDVQGQSVASLRMTKEQLVGLIDGLQKIQKDVEKASDNS